MADYEDDYFEEEGDGKPASSPAAKAAAPVQPMSVVDEDEYGADEFETAPHPPQPTQRIASTASDGYGDDAFEDENSHVPSATSRFEPPQVKRPTQTQTTAAPIKPAPNPPTTTTASKLIGHGSSADSEPKLDEYEADDFEIEHSTTTPNITIAPTPTLTTPATATTYKIITPTVTTTSKPSPPIKPTPPPATVAIPVVTTPITTRPPSAQSQTTHTLEPSYSQESFSDEAAKKSVKQKPTSIDDAPVDYKDNLVTSSQSDWNHVTKPSAASIANQPTPAPVVVVKSTTPTSTKPSASSTATTKSHAPKATSSSSKPSSPSSTHKSTTTTTPKSVTSPTVAAAAAKTPTHAHTNAPKSPTISKPHPHPALVPAAALSDDYEDDFEVEAKKATKTTKKSTIAPPPSTSNSTTPVTSPRTSSSHPPPKSKPKALIVEPPAAHTDTKKAADYDRQRREQLKARREQSAALAAKRHGDEEKTNKPSSPSKTASSTQSSPKAASSTNKPPILPPPSPPSATSPRPKSSTAHMTDAEFLNSILGPKKGAASTVASTSTTGAKPSSPQNRAKSAHTQRSKTPTRTRSRSRSVVRSPSPNKSAATANSLPQTEEKQQPPPPEIDASNPHIVYTFNDTKAGYFAPRPPSSNGGVSGAHTTRSRSRASNAWARQRIISGLSVGQGLHPGRARSRSGSRPRTRPHTSYSVRSSISSYSRPPPSQQSVASWVAAQQAADTLEARAIVARATSILREVASDTTAAHVQADQTTTGETFADTLKPLNATLPVEREVPRCYPASHITSRVSAVRFKRQKMSSARVRQQQMKQQYTGQQQEGGWNVAAELQYGHTLLEGLKARTANLASNLESHGSSQTSGAEDDKQALFQSIRVTQSLENYYSLLSQLDISVKKQTQDKSMLHQVLFEPQISGQPQPPSPLSARHPSPSPNVSDEPWHHTNHHPRPAAPSDLPSSYASRPPSAHTAGNLTHGGAPVRPLSGRREHPNLPPTFIPPYDSVTDPHVVLFSPSRAKIIRETRAEEWKTAPEYNRLLDAREQSWTTERAETEQGLEDERRRKLRMDRPPEEKISQRPRSATGAAPSTTNAPNQQQQHKRSASKSSQPPPRPPTKTDMTSRLKMVNSVYSHNHNAATNHASSAYPRPSSGVSSSSRATSAIWRPPQTKPAGAGHGHTTSHDYLNGIPAGLVRDVDGEDDGDDDAEVPTKSNIDQLTDVDWFTITQQWPPEPSQLTKDLRALGVIYGEQPDPSSPSKSDTSNASSLPEDSPTRLCSDFYLAERCLQALHAQLGLPFIVSSDTQQANATNGGDEAKSESTSFKFTSTHPPTLLQIHALKDAIHSLITCRDIVMRILSTMKAREDILKSATATPTPATLSKLSTIDHTLLSHLTTYASTFRSTFPHRPEFSSGRFIWRHGDLAERVLAEKQRLIQRTTGSGSGSGSGGGSHSRGVSASSRSSRPSSSTTYRGATGGGVGGATRSVDNRTEVPIERLASVYSQTRSAHDIAAAAASIVLTSLAEQARGIKMAQFQGGYY